MTAFDALAARVHEAADSAELEAAADEARELGIGPAQAAGTARQARPARRAHAVPRIAGSGGRAILVGRGASDNDRLTLDHARPQDLWLHRATRPELTSSSRSNATKHARPTARDAAMLAAHFSQARGPRVSTSRIRRVATCESRARPRPAACSSCAKRCFAFSSSPRACNNCSPQNAIAADALERRFARKAL